MDPRLSRALDRWACSDPRLLSGDAGARQCVRVAHPHLGTALVMLYPLDEPGKNDPAYYEFRAMHAYLDPVMRVPTIVQTWDEEKVLLVEDLGDVTLERRLTEHPEEERAWADRAGCLLATLLGPLTVGAPPHSFFMARAFDTNKLDFEWGYCQANFFHEFLQKDSPRWLDRLMLEIHESLAPRAQFLAHRDFHVRNLRVQGDRLVVFDFQDARRGAATYDLASILFDGYWDWSKEAGSLLLRHVREELGWSDATLWEELNLSALQRNFQTLGTCGYQLIKCKKAQFAPAIPRTLRHLRTHFQRLNHGEGVLASENWMRIAEKRLWKEGRDETTGAPS